jgi:hypothetical protein
MENIENNDNTTDERWYNFFKILYNSYIKNKKEKDGCDV